jgi:hypothetical protein
MNTLPASSALLNGSLGLRFTAVVPYNTLPF